MKNGFCLRACIACPGRAWRGRDGTGAAGRNEFFVTSAGLGKGGDLGGLAGLFPGLRGFHAHENPSCAPGLSMSNVAPDQPPNPWEDTVGTR